MGKVTASIVWTGSKERGESLLAAISPDDPDDFTVELMDFSKNYFIFVLAFTIHKEKFVLRILI